MCSATLKSTPVVIQSPNVSAAYTVNASALCGACASLSCSFGLTGACSGPDDFNVTLGFVSLYPTPYCNVTFFDDGRNAYLVAPLAVALLPTRIAASNLWIPRSGAVTGQPTASGNGSSLLRARGALSFALVNYSAAPRGVPLFAVNTTLRVRACPSAVGDNSSDSTTTTSTTSGNTNASRDNNINFFDDSWRDLRSFPVGSAPSGDALARIPLSDSASFTRISLCLQIAVTAPPMRTTRTTIVVPLADDASGDSGGNFQLGDGSTILVEVSEGRYLPPVTAEEPKRVSAVSASAFADAPGSSPVSSGVSSVSEFNAPTFAVVAGSLLGGAVLAYVVYQWVRPRPRDHVGLIANAMMAPSDTAARR